jgi:hypothetical protein
MTRSSLVFLALLFAIVPARAEEWEPAKTHAVLVGVLEWQNGLGGFSKTHRKDQELRDLLVKRGVLAENITLLLDKDATLPKIREAIAKTLKRTNSDSTLIVYYAGHGMPGAGGDFYFANYEIKNPKTTGWSLKELGSTLAADFHGRRVFLWADCCFSGGLEVVVDELAKKKIGAFNLTSASTANTSTSNWTFTQSIIDGLRGEPLIDANGDGKITLSELNVEVREAMKHMEGQKHGFKSSDIPDDFVMAKASGPRPVSINAKLNPGSYVETPAGGTDHFGRVVGADGDKVRVQFYDYCDKRIVNYPAKDLKVSTREPGQGRLVVDGGVKPDCQVEWQGQWYDAKVMKKEKDRWYIHYVGYDNSWDEWVAKDRIKFK